MFAYGKYRDRYRRAPARRRSSALKKPLGAAETATLAPAAGAGKLKVIVLAMVRAVPTPDPAGVTVIVGVATVTATLPCWYAPPEATMLVLPPASGVTVTFAPVEF